jgi:hypothetical protein
MIPVRPEVTEKNMSQLVTKDAKAARAIQSAMDGYPHFPLAHANSQRGEATMRAGKRLEVDANAMPCSIFDGGMN